MITYFKKSYDGKKIVKISRMRRGEDSYANESWNENTNTWIYDDDVMSTYGYDSSCFFEEITFEEAEMLKKELKSENSLKDIIKNK